MTDSSLERSGLLAKTIYANLSSEIILDSSSLHYLESTLDITAPNELELFLREDTCEKNALLQFLTYPSTSSRLSIENILLQQGCSKKDLRSIINEVYASKPQTSIYFPGFDRPVHYTLPLETIKDYVQRLNLCQNLPAELLACLDQRFDLQNYLHIRSMLRASSLSLNQVQSKTLCTFLDKFPLHEDLFLHLKFLLTFLRNISKQESVWSNLVYNRNILEQAIYKSSQSEELIRNQAMEALMMQREYLYIADKQNLQEQIAIIDRICLTLFDKLPPTPDLSTNLAFTKPAAPDTTD